MSETRTVRLLRALLKPSIELENVYQQLLTECTLDNAVGVQLATIGKKVGQGSEGLDDESFRTLCRARIRANKSSGLGDQVLFVARLVLGSYAATPAVLAAGTMKLALINYGNATFVLRVENVDLPWSLAMLLIGKFLRKMVGTGIRVIVEFVVQHDAVQNDHVHAFAFDTDGDGWGDTLDATSGGVLASAME